MTARPMRTISAGATCSMTRWQRHCPGRACVVVVRVRQRAHRRRSSDAEGALSVVCELLQDARGQLDDAVDPVRRDRGASVRYGRADVRERVRQADGRDPGQVRRRRTAEGLERSADRASASCAGQSHGLAFRRSRVAASVLRSSDRDTEPPGVDSLARGA